MKVRIRRVTYEDRDLDSSELMTMKQAAEVLGLTIQGVRSAMDRGRLTEVINEDAPSPQVGYRLVLRSEVEEEAERRQRAAEKWGEGGSGC